MKKFLISISLVVAVALACIAVQATMTHPSQPVLGSALGAVNTAGIQVFPGMENGWYSTGIISLTGNTGCAVIRPSLVVPAKYYGPVKVLLVPTIANAAVAFVPASMTAFTFGLPAPVSQTTESPCLNKNMVVQVHTSTNDTGAVFYQIFYQY